MPKIGTFVAEFVASMDGFIAPIKQAQRESKEFTDRVKPISKAMDDVGKSMTGVGVAISAIGVPFALVAKNALDAADSFSEMAERTGASVEVLSALTLEADKSGTSIDAVEKAIKASSKVMEDASIGTEAAAKSLAKLGLSAEQLLSLSPDERFFAIAQGIAGIEDPSIRAATAMEVWGKTGTDMLPMLDALALGSDAVVQHARTFNAVVTKEGAEAANHFNDSLTNLTRALGGVFNSLVSSGLINQLTEFINVVATGIGTFSQAHPNIVAIGAALGAVAAVVGPLLTGFGLMLSGLSSLVPVIASVAGYLGIAGAGTGLTGALAAVVGILTGPVGVVLAISAGVTALGVFLSKNKDVIDAVDAIWKTWGPTFTALFNGVWTGIKTVFETTWNTIKGILSGAFNIIKGAIQVFAGVVTGDWDLFAKGIKSIWSGMWETIKSIMLAPLNAIKGSVTGFTDGVTGAFKTMYDKIVGHSYVPDLIAGIEAAFGKLPGIMNTPSATATDSVTVSFKGMFESIVNAAKNWKDTLLNIVDQVASGLLSKIPGVSSTLGKITGVLNGGGGSGGGAVGGSATSSIAGSVFSGLSGGIIAGGLAAVGGIIGGIVGNDRGAQRETAFNTGATYLVLKDTAEQILWPQYGLISFIADQAKVLGYELIPEIGYWATQIANVTMDVGNRIIAALGGIAAAAASGGGGGGGDWVPPGLSFPTASGGTATITPTEPVPSFGAQGAATYALFSGGALGGGGFGSGGLATYNLLAGNLPTYAMGTPYVPRTGLAVVHQGEEIVPAGGAPQINITVNVAGSVTTEAELTRRIMSSITRIVEKGGGSLTARGTKI